MQDAMYRVSVEDVSGNQINTAAYQTEVRARRGAETVLRNPLYESTASAPVPVRDSRGANQVGTRGDAGKATRHPADPASVTYAGDLRITWTEGRHACTVGGLGIVVVVHLVLAVLYVVRRS